MATAAFKSTSRRSALGAADDTGSANRAGAHRRSRSLSRFSGRFAPPAPAEGDELLAPRPRGRFVNADGGAGFPEISLDDLADEFFAAAGGGDEGERERGGGRGGRRLSDVGFQMETESSRRRGRSVSRKGENSFGVKGVSDGNARRRRSVSVARQRCSDSESYSSTLADDEARVARENNSSTEKTIRTVYAQKKTEHSSGDVKGNGLYQAMRKEVRHAVEEIRSELEKVIVKTKSAVRHDVDDIQPKGSEVFEAVAEIRSYTTKLEESDKRKQELLAELAAEEQRGQELTKIVRELLPYSQESSPPERPSRLRKRSNDRTRMSKHLSEEAEKYFVDFISSVEETDISSFDGDKSDGSSTIGGMKSSATAGTRACLAKTWSLPAEIDGLILPWLEWETCSDRTPLSCHGMSKMGGSLVSGTKLFDPKQILCFEIACTSYIDIVKNVMSLAPSSLSLDDLCPLKFFSHLKNLEDITVNQEAEFLRACSQEASSTNDDSMCFTSSRGSWSPDDNDDNSIISKNKLSSRVADAGSHLNSGTKFEYRVSPFEMDDYHHLQHSEDFLFEGLQQRQRIESGGLVLCRRSFLSH